PAQPDVLALLEDVDQSTEQVGGEVDVDFRGLVVQQWNAVPDLGDGALARQRKRTDLRCSGGSERGANQLFLDRQGRFEVGSRFFQGAETAIEQEQQFLRVWRRHAARFYGAGWFNSANADPAHL